VRAWTYVWGAYAGLHWSFSFFMLLGLLFVHQLQDFRPQGFIQ
jgi:hypothetical protein